MPLVLKSFSGDLSTNARFQEWLLAKMDASVVAGANEVVDSHLRILAGWNRKPDFTQKDLSDMGRLLALREIRVTGANAWKWILTNYGGSTIKNGPIIGKYMKFPFQGRGASYAAATDTQAAGQRLGAPTVFFNVLQRDIKPRNMIGRVSREFRSEVYAAMRTAFNG